MTRPIATIVADAHGQTSAHGPVLVAGYAKAARELADDHGMTIGQIARQLGLTEAIVLRYLNEDVWIRLGEKA